jgi:hypothetical protein
VANHSGNKAFAGRACIEPSNLCGVSAISQIASTNANLGQDMWIYNMSSKRIAVDTSLTN